MPTRAKTPTPDPDLNAVLLELVKNIQTILGDNFIAAYLQGSFAIGDWDIYSDVDFLVAIDQEISEEELPALQAMHARIYNLESSWAKHLDGSYFPREILKHGDPTKKPLLYLDNAHDALIRSDHDNSLVVRWMVREHGITLAGPEPRELMDPVSADDLRQEVRTTMHEWAEDIFSGRWPMNNRWAQPFAVLSYCRMLHTLQTGRIHSKPAGARWAKSALDKGWASLIQRASDERPDPSWKVRQNADPDDLRRTIEFIRYALAVSRQSQNNR
jgi:predicted nucleotidyltransferase